MGHQGYDAWPDSNDGSVSVTDSSAVKIAANPKRQTLYLHNKSLTTTIWYRFGAAVTAGEGKAIGPGGVVGYDLLEDQRDGWQRKAVHAATAADTADLAYSEQSTP